MIKSLHSIQGLTGKPLLQVTLTSMLLIYSFHFRFAFQMTMPYVAWYVHALPKMFSSCEFHCVLQAMTLTTVYELGWEKV